MSEPDPASLIQRLLSLLFIPITTLLNMISNYPSSSTTSSTGNADTEKADDIHAFRSITTFLETLRQFPIDKIPDNAPTEGPQADELKIYSALAAITVMDLEVLAVNSNIVKVLSDASNDATLGSRESLPRADSESIAGDNTGISVVVSPGEEKRSMPALRREKLSGAAKVVYHYLCVFVNNFLKRDVANAPTTPSFKEIVPPAGFSLDTDADFIKFIKEYPSNMGRGRRLKLEEHLWVVQRLITMKKEVNHRTRLLRYIIATCVVKLYRRVRWTRWSRIYTASLENIREQGPVSMPMSTIPESNGPEPTPSDPESDRKQRKIEQKRNGHDFRFLTDFVLDNGQAREFKVRGDPAQYIPSTAAMPNILARATQAIAAGSLNGSLYDSTTHHEIGLLLPYLLEQNSLALGHLQFLLGLRSESEKPDSRATQKAAAAAKEDGRSINEAIDDAVLFGTAIWRLSQGSALRQYLMHMEPLLYKHDPDDVWEKPLSGDGMNAAGQTDGTNVDDDDDMDAGRMDNTKANWQRYLDWLEIISSHYNAVWTLRSFFKDNKRHITIRLLATPPVDNKMMSWRNLLSDTNNFPGSTHWDSESGVKALTNGDISKCLDKAAKVYKDTKFLDQLTSKSPHRTPKQLKSLNSYLESLENCNVNTLADLAKTARKHIGTGTYPSSATYYTVTDHASLNKSLKEFRRWIDLFKFLNGETDPADKNARGKVGSLRDGFKGSLHCEVALSSLMHDEVKDSDQFSALVKELKTLGNVIGVSKRCCPVCRHLLDMLITGTEGQREKFIVQASHETVTACTLPRWLPDHIVTAMNMKFGDYLRRELVWFIGKPRDPDPTIQHHQRVLSTDSAPLDSDTGSCESDS